MIRLIYVSQANHIDFNQTKAILDVSSKHNKDNQITGVLIYGQNYFIECLEGSKQQVKALYKRIILDQRHEHIELISKEEIQDRYFDDWNFSLMNKHIYDDMVQRHSDNGLFNPYSMRPEHLIKILDELSRVV